MSGGILAEKEDQSIISSIASGNHDPKLYEEQMQKYEGDIRMHISVSYAFLILQIEQ